MLHRHLRPPAHQVALGPPGLKWRRRGHQGQERCVWHPCNLVLVPSGPGRSLKLSFFEPAGCSKVFPLFWSAFVGSWGFPCWTPPTVTSADNPPQLCNGRYFSSLLFVVVSTNIYCVFYIYSIFCISCKIVHRVKGWSEPVSIFCKITLGDVENFLLRRTMSGSLSFLWG